MIFIGNPEPVQALADILCSAMLS